MLAERNLLRVSDAEREAAASALGDHLATGRLTIAEYEERVGQAWAARYGGELAELFTDLPVTRHPVSVRRGPSPFVLAPILLAVMAVGMIIAIVQVVPVVFFVLLGMFAFSHRRRAHYRRQWGHHPRRMRAISV